MFKKILPLLLTIACLSSLSAQEGGRMSYELYPQFEGDTLLVVMEEDSDYDKALIQGISEHWKLTPYRFVSKKELLPLANQEAYTMVVLDQSSKTRGRSVIRRKHLSLFPCGRSADLTNYGGKYAVSQFSLYDIENKASYIGKLPFLLQSMQQYLTFMDTVQNLGEDTFEPKLEAWKNSQRQKIKEMTLIIPADLITGSYEEEKLREAYPYPLKVVKTSQLGNYMKMEKGEKALYHLDARKRYLTVIGQDGQVLFCEEVNSPGEFSLKDLKQLAKAVDKPYVVEKSLESRLDRFNGKLNKLFGN